MKKALREEFLILNLLQQEIPDGRGTTFTVGWPCLCQWCKYSRWTGTACSDDGDLECLHPLWKQELWNENEVWESSDCWAFKPKYRREDCVDVVGLWLQGKYVDWNSVPELGRAKR
jgi:hypothetical protein